MQNDCGKVDNKFKLKSNKSTSLEIETLIKYYLILWAFVNNRDPELFKVNDW